MSTVNITKKIEDQIKDVLSVDDTFTNTPKPSENTDVQASIGDFNLQAGPADLPSYHDFQTIQLAFEHIWTEVFDESLEQKAKELYDEWVKLDIEPELTDIPEEITNLEELEYFRSELARLTMSIAGEDDRLIAVRQIVPSISIMDWANMDETTKGSVFVLVEEVLRAQDGGELQTQLETLREQRRAIRAALGRNSGEYEAITSEINALEDELTQISSMTEQNKEHINQIIEAGKIVKHNALENLLKDIDERLKEPTSFEVYAPNSINFGILTTFRQKWNPINYQVGELISTIPLTPGESRTYTKKTVQRMKRSEKEIEKNQEIKKRSLNETSRSDAEIVRKATHKSNFSASAEGSGNILAYKVSAKTNFSTDTGKDSQQTKKQFREAIINAAQEYKHDHHLEISTDTSLDFEDSSTSTITNTNQEIPVTYLFYELQRRYEISEKLHRVTPVILVANEVPHPHEIDEDWIITYDWILRRVILDDSYFEAMDYLSSGDFVGDSMSMEILRVEVGRQLRIVEKITEQVSAKRRALSATIRRIGNLVNQRASIAEHESSEGLFGKAKDFLFGSSSNEANEGIQIKEDHKRELLDTLTNESKTLEQQLEEEIISLEKVSTKYNEIVKKYFSKKLQVNRLRIHIKENVLYYMQAIWSSEFDDQRFFRLKNIETPTFTVQYALDTATASPPSYMEIGKPSPMANGLDSTNLRASLGLQLIQPKKETSSIVDDSPLRPNSPYLDLLLRAKHRSIQVVKKKLVEVADLGNLLGFVGNYMVFPLKQPNRITNFMMQNYVDETIGNIVDPDEFSNYSYDELKIMLEELHQKDSSLFTQEFQDKMKELLQEILIKGNKEKETIIVPTDSLFVEALPGTHPVLEQFKLTHRAIDVEKFKETLRQERLESLRKSGKILVKSDYTDEIDKKIQVLGNGVNNVNNVTDGT